MKSIALLSLIYFYTTLQISAQEMTFQKGGKILFNQRLIDKPADILTIISEKNTPELSENFNKYKSNRGAANVFGFLGGFGIGWPIGGVLGGKKFNTGVFAGGVGTLLIGIAFQSSSNKSLQKVVDLYNGDNAKSVSFVPFIDVDQNITKAGLRIGF